MNEHTNHVAYDFDYLIELLEELEALDDDELSVADWIDQHQG